jgi:hypothetical protein
MWAPVFWNYDMKNNIVISAVVNGNDEKMTIKYNPNYVQASIPSNVITKGMKHAQIRTDQKPEPSYSLDIIYDSKKLKGQTAHLLMGLDGIGIRVDKVKMTTKRAAFLGARIPINPSEDAQKFGQLDILGKQENIVDFLKIIEPDLKSLSSIAVGDTSLIHGDIGLSRKIPVTYMGDGVARLLSIILSIATSKDGIVLIDECENGFHYSVMPKIWEAIARASREYNCQVIGTTHSYECLEAAYNGISEELKNDFSYVRIDKSDNIATAKCFAYEMLKVAIESNMEVR